MRFLLAAAAAGGVNTHKLAHQARVPTWALADSEAMIHPCHALRLWELVEQALGTPDVGFRVAARYQLGDLGLYDYLFRTTATLGDGLETSSRYLPLITTNGMLRTQAHAEHETTYSFAYLNTVGRGEELALQFSIAMLCARARAGTGQPVIPVHVGFSQPAPRSYRVFTETFGTRQIDFGVPATTFTLASGHLELPMRDADPALATILRHYAASLPPPAVADWLDHFRGQLSDEIERGSPSLAALARRMWLSGRTLQRRLTEHGTNWRAELDAARRFHAFHARQTGSPSMAHLARQLGYADPRSARRALRRWNSRTT